MNYQIEKARPEDFEEIVEVWEASVRATHDFLPETFIPEMKPLILNEYLKLVDLSCIRNDTSEIIGFSGIAEGKIEMLFIRPDWRGKGVGKMLMHHAIGEQKATEVDVNEQNPQAVGFYKYLGFEITGRSELDGQGNPYPLIHLAWPK